MPNPPAEKPNAAERNLLAFLAQVNAAAGHAAEISPYVLDSFLQDAELQIRAAYRAGQEEMRGRACMIEGPLRSALLRCIAEIETLLAPTPKGLGGMRREYLAKLKGSALGGIGEGKAAIQGEEITALEIKESPNE